MASTGQKEGQQPPHPFTFSQCLINTRPDGSIAGSFSGKGSITFRGRHGSLTFNVSEAEKDVLVISVFTWKGSERRLAAALTAMPDR